MLVLLLSCKQTIHSPLDYKHTSLLGLELGVLVEVDEDAFVALLLEEELGSLKFSP
jgi:hypothetical protein